MFILLFKYLLILLFKPTTCLSKGTDSGVENHKCSSVGRPLDFQGDSCRSESTANHLCDKKMHFTSVSRGGGHLFVKNGLIVVGTPGNKVMSINQSYIV